MKSWLRCVEEDENGDCIINLPDELIERMGWKEGDILDCNVNDDGTILLKKK